MVRKFELNILYLLSIKKVLRTLLLLLRMNEIKFFAIQNIILL